MIWGEQAAVLDRNIVSPESRTSMNGSFIIGSLVLASF